MCRDVMCDVLWCLQAAAGMGVFGPRTVYCIALKDAPGCHEFLLQDDGKWVHVKETTEIGQCSSSPPLPSLHAAHTSMACVHPTPLSPPSLHARHTNMACVHPPPLPHPCMSSPPCILFAASWTTPPPPPPSVLPCPLPAGLGVQQMHSHDRATWSKLAQCQKLLCLTPASPGMLGAVMFYGEMASYGVHDAVVCWEDVLVVCEHQASWL